MWRSDPVVAIGTVLELDPVPSDLDPIGTGYREGGEDAARLMVRLWERERELEKRWPRRRRAMPLPVAAAIVAVGLIVGSVVIP